MRRKQHGFTLIELVVVIVILGILAAVAAPKYIDIADEAYVAKINAIEASLKSANALVHSKAIIHNLDLGDSTLSINAESIAIYNGYIAALADNIPKALDAEFTVISNFDDPFDTDYAIRQDASSVTIVVKPGASGKFPTCNLMYTLPEAASSKPAYFTSEECG